MTYQVILNSCPDRQSAEKIAQSLVNEKLAACVNILPGMTSIYSWKDQIECEQEHLLIIKTHRHQYAAIESSIRHLHPYELPEIIAVPIDRGLPEYLQWIDSCLSIK
jgi:periplasmic divalent cation tolerance protein